MDPNPQRPEKLLRLASTFSGALLFCSRNTTTVNLNKPNRGVLGALSTTGSQRDCGFDHICTCFACGWRASFANVNEHDVPFQRGGTPSHTSAERVQWRTSAGAMDSF